MGVVTESPFGSFGPSNTWQKFSSSHVITTFYNQHQIYISKNIQGVPFIWEPRIWLCPLLRTYYLLCLLHAKYITRWTTKHKAYAWRFCRSSVYTECNKNNFTLLVFNFFKYRFSKEIWRFFWDTGTDKFVTPSIIDTSVYTSK